MYMYSCVWQWLTLIWISSLQRRQAGQIRQTASPEVISEEAEEGKGGQKEGMEGTGGKRGEDVERKGWCGKIVWKGVKAKGGREECGRVKSTQEVGEGGTLPLSSLPLSPLSCIPLSSGQRLWDASDSSVSSGWLPRQPTRVQTRQSELVPALVA